MWQDYVIASGAFIFIIALIPSVLGKQKPAFATSIVTTATLLILTMTFLTLNLWLSAVADFLNALVWLVLAWQVWKRRLAK